MSRRGVVAGVVAGLGAAVTTGVLVDRRIGKRLEAAAREGDVDNLGSLRGEVHRIRTSDGHRPARRDRRSLTSRR